MIDIKDINGNVIQSVIITQNAERVIELMKADYVQLSWSSDEGTILPVGAYIEYKGEKFSLLEPYTPEQKDELEYEYKPQFQSKVMAWGKTPLFLYTQTESGIRKETDWVLTDNPANFMSYIADALYKELGEQWNYAVSAGLAASATITFSTSDIYSALNSIASAFETEWWVDKEGYTIHLGKCEHGNAIDLEVGVNVKTPSITRSKEGYFTRFYAFGSTRNIEQDYEGANANNIVNKRLTLDPTKYPEGYKNIREGLKDGEIFSKVLIFDDIYPSSKLSISNVRVRLLYRLDDDNNKVQVGTDSNGNPIYDQYAIWYFQLPDFTFNEEDVIEGLVPSVNFKTGALAGREFEIIYHDKDKEVTTTDGEPFKVLAGDYEICFIEEGTYIIPSVTGLTPTEGDEIVLFNIKMPEEYKQSAYDELEEALDKEIARMNSDLNTYQLQSDAVAFYNDNPNLTLGQKVRYTNGAYSFETRVMKLVTKLDYECEQAITIGNEKIKGNTEQLKEEVVNANTNINLLALLNETTNSLTQAYQRTQKMMMEGFASIKDMWLFDENDKNTIYSKFNIYSLGYVSAKGANPNGGGSSEGGATTIGGLRNVAADADSTYDVAKTLVLEANSNLWTLKNLSELVGGLDEAELAEYLAKNNYAKKGDIPSLSGYATEQWVLGKGYATTSDLDARIDALVNGAPQAYDTLKEIADVLANNINSIDDILTALGTKVSKDDFNTAIANVNTAIDSLNTELGLKLDAVTFNELFEKVQLEDGTWAIKAKLGLFSDGFISAKGSNVGGTSSEGGAVALYQLNDVLADGTGVSGATDGAVFVYDGKLGKWKGIAQSEIVPNLTGYAKESWVLSQGFLTQHQDLSDYAKLTDIPTIPTTDINKGVTAYGWGDHSKVGYLTGITSALVKGALGYTPYNAANFTKAAIKSTLGISDWALASSKPSYTTKEVAEDTNLYFTDARAVAALKSITDGLSSSITSNTTKITNLTTKVDDHIAVFNSMFKLVELSDGTMSIQALHGLWSDGFISAKGANSSGGSSSGGGLITSLYRYADLGKTFADTSNDTFNAYTINKINSDLGSRISVLEGKATNVSFTQSLTSGTQIGTITIDGASKNIYAPTIPTKLSHFTDDVVSGNYLPLSGGTLTNLLTLQYANPRIAFKTNSNTTLASLGFFSGNLSMYVNADGKYYDILHTNNYSSYALPLSGGTMGGDIVLPDGKLIRQNVSNGSALIGVVSNNFLVGTVDNPLNLRSNGTSTINGNTLIHSGNYTDYTYSKSQVDSKLGGYLPLSGGTLTGSFSSLTISSWADNKIILNETGSDTKYQYIEFQNNSVRYGMLGTFGTDDLKWNTNILIHSGNIGSQSVAYASNAGLLDNISSSGFARNSVYPSASDNNWGIPTGMYSTSSVTNGLPLSGVGNYVIHCNWDGNAANQLFLAYDRDYFAFRRKASNVWYDWKEVAFTDSNVASATTAASITINYATSDAKFPILFTNQHEQWVSKSDSIYRDNTSRLGYNPYNDILYANNIQGSGISPYITDKWNDGTNDNYWHGLSIRAVNSIYNTVLSGYYGVTLKTGGGIMALANSGNVGIGTTSPTSLLHLYSLNTAEIKLASDGTGGDTAMIYEHKGSGNGFTFAEENRDFIWRVGSAAVSTIGGGTEVMRLTNNGNVGIGTTSPQYKLDVSGVIRSTTGIFSDGYVSAKGQNTSSDMRLKNVLNEVVLGVKDIANAPSVRFSWKNGGGIDVGSSAQYWQGLLPDAVKERDGMLEMQYANIALLSAIAIAKNVETHEERIARLEKENEELRTKIDMMKGCIYE